jgi:hypothetical protein
MTTHLDGRSAARVRTPARAAAPAAFWHRLQNIEKYADEPRRSPGWIPFVDTVTGDRLCLDLNPDPSGGIEPVFMYCHDDDPEPPIAANLLAWLERIVIFVVAGGIVYDTTREEFLPFYDHIVWIHLAAAEE